MTERTMIERVARAIGSVEMGMPVGEPGERWRNWEEAARAAIVTMRDLDAGTSEMLRVGQLALSSTSSDTALDDARFCWHAMIDCALGVEHTPETIETKLREAIERLGRA